MEQVKNRRGMGEHPGRCLKWHLLLGGTDLMDSESAILSLAIDARVMFMFHQCCRPVLRPFA